MLKLYSFFHLNIMYSSISEEKRAEVIDQCYWPIFELADSEIPIGIEAPALTLEIIFDISPNWIKKLSEYIDNGKIEFIGSGYSQIIGPLIPAKINNWNQKIGLEIYHKLLKIKPKVALINEMAYSAGLVEHYINNKYEAMIMEWNNPRSYHPEWKNEWRFYPQFAEGSEKHSIPLIWADSIAFQKFQRYVHGEYELDDYLNYIKSFIGNSDRYFPFYSNDVEIFNYRPGRYYSEPKIKILSEWKKIIELYNFIGKQDWCEFIFPSDILKSLDNINAGQRLKLESPSQPIPVKKQEKYNINRWALTGRDDLGINTKCYQLYTSFIVNDNNNQSDWKELCLLWSSDFRTHITQKRWKKYCIRLNAFVNKYSHKSLIESKEPSIISNKYSIFMQKNLVIIENEKLKIILNKNKGLIFEDIVFKDLSKKSLLGTLDQGYYDDISLGADYFSGHTVIERLAEHKITDLGKVEAKFFKSNDKICFKTIQKLENYTINKTIDIIEKKVIIYKTIESMTYEKSIIRPFSITFKPEAWDRNSLYIETHNGGTNTERFYLKGQSINHGDIYSSLISARHGYGNTGGIFIVGDKNKTLSFFCDMSFSALIPSIIYKEMEDTYFFRLQYSARELDETLKPTSKKKNHIRTKLIIS